MKQVLILVFAVLAANTACGDDSAPGAADAASIDAATDAAVPPTWTNFAESFMETYCQACHGPGDALRDYALLSMVRAEMDKIRCGVSPIALPNCTIPAKQFPVGNGPMPDDTARNRLVQWIDDGAPE